MNSAKMIDRHGKLQNSKITKRKQRVNLGRGMQKAPTRAGFGASRIDSQSTGAARKGLLGDHARQGPAEQSAKSHAFQRQEGEEV